MARYDTHWQSRVRKKREARVRWGKLLVGPGAFLALLLVAWAVIDSPLLRVKAVNVAGAPHMDNEAIVDAARGAQRSFFARMVTAHNLLGWPDELPSETVALLPGAKTVEIDRSYFAGTVTLTVDERKPVGVWCFEATGTPVCQWFDEEGVVYGRAFLSRGSLLPVVHDRSQERASEGRRVLPPDQLENFLAIHGVLKSRSVSPKEVVIAEAGKQEVSMETYNGPRLLFTLRRAPDQVAPVLDDFIKKGTLSGTRYIDFRVQKRAFYE